MNRLKVFVAMAGLGAATIAMSSLPQAKAETNSNNPDGLTIMTFKQ